ncbi:MAG: 3-oxoacyl-ACP reductase family protein [Acidobacteriaceae bacterium]
MPKPVAEHQPGWRKGPCTIEKMDNLEGKTALVTGASRGIGRAIALSLAGAGANVVVNFLSRSKEAEAVEMEIQQMGRRCARVQADVSVTKDVERLARETQERVGTVDILVNNAGIARAQAIEEIAESDWDDLIDTNLKSCFLVTQAFLPAMRARKWGRIINLSSAAAQIGGVVGPHYAASKAGMLGLTYYYARYLAKEGITVNAIAPALVETDMTRENVRASASNIPVGRFGSVDEVSDVAVLLAKNGYITGQTINVNGGWVMS